MESFFYVVLYAGIRWLPHDFSGDLTREMKLFFDNCYESSGMVVGGALKRNNIFDEFFVDLFEWENEHLENWIKGVLLLQQLEINNQDAPTWTAERLHRLWLRIDESISPEDDRFEHPIFVNYEPVKDAPVPATICAMESLRQAQPSKVNSVQSAPAEMHNISKSSRRKRHVDVTEREQPKRPRRSNVRY